MSPTRLEYKDLGLELVSLEDKNSLMPKRPLMVGEKKYEGRRDPFKLLIEEALMQQRNEMMDSFLQIPIFEGYIDADAIDKWLNLLDRYFSVDNFSNREKITFSLLKVVPHVKYWWETLCNQKET
jgi:hypothetical protein